MSADRPRERLEAWISATDGGRRAPREDLFSRAGTRWNPVAHDLTSIHIARAHDGDETSQAWWVARFSPFLQLQASYRRQGSLRRRCDPDDLVDEVWLAAATARRPQLGGAAVP